mmetsp:Transcript_65933/g.187088  ORF Transcript_65933/g.187088 Transcript_65933/m.187088 type:complete len:209 (-) Transcript_65933:116-742(-)
MASEWTCHQCTLINQPGATFCAVCDAPCPASAVVDTASAGAGAAGQVGATPSGGCRRPRPVVEPTPKKKPRINMKGFSEALDDSAFLDFLKAKLHKKDAGVVKLVGEFRSLPKRSTCVFCSTRFNLAHPGKCCVHHQIDEWEQGDDYRREINFNGRATYHGTCSLCGESVSAQGGDCEAPDDCEEICYSGPHVSEFPDGYGEGSEHST